MEQKAGAQIGQKAFIQSLLILLALMIVAGVLTLVVPAGQYARLTVDGRDVIDAASFQTTPRPDYPVWRWLTAPLEVLGGSDGTTIIVIIVFLLMVGAAFALLDRSGLLRAGLARLVRAFGPRKYALLLTVSFVFMALGAFFGIFEEIVPLVPVIIALSYALGWDSLVGLGMSLLATNLGFSTAISNPFTLGVAQRLAGLPLFSGAELRVVIFLVVFVVFALFLTNYARRIERDPSRSPVHAEDSVARARYADLRLDDSSASEKRLLRGLGVLLAVTVVIAAVLLAGPFVPALSAVSLPLVGLLFLLGSAGAAWSAGTSGRSVGSALLEGVSGIAPAIPLILMAASIKHIVASGGILDTLLHSASAAFAGANPFVATLLIYVLALFIEFFIGSGSAKAFLLMPILLPLADLVGVTRQTTVLAYIFGDGFSNLAYPTNPVLLIALGLTVVSYAKWMRWTLDLWLWIGIVTVAALGLAVAIGYGPF